MILKAYCIFDKAVKAFNAPMFVQNEAQAVRAFSDTVNSDETVIFRHPEQFSLSYIGELDDQTGIFTAPSEPEFIVAAASLHQPRDADGDRLVAQLQNLIANLQEK